MALAMWNVRGLNSAERKLEVKKHMRRNKVEIFGLLEPKVKTKKFA